MAVVKFVLSVNLLRQHLHDLYFDIWKGPKLNANTSLESKQPTSYVSAVVIFAISVIVYKILKLNICMTFTLTYRMSKGQM